MTGLDPHPHLFETEEFIGEGQQAQLDIAIDNNAKRGRLPLPTPLPTPLPGQEQL